MIFVTLHVGMKDRILRFSALLLMLWYCFSVIGFGIHTCRASDRSFVATFISGLTCADIHPEHECDKEHCSESAVHHCCGSAHADDECCRSEEDGMSLKQETCCSNDYLVLSITGNLIDSEGHGTYLTDVISFPSISLVPSVFNQDLFLYRYHHIPDSGPGVHWDMQSLLNIWRI